MGQPFSPILLAGMFLRPLPQAPANHLVQKLFYDFGQRHLNIMERLESIEGATFLVTPMDLPYPVHLQITASELNARLAKQGETCDVHITGSIKDLIDMLDSEADGDALFFSRKLTVQGDTEALLTLRNALDSEDIVFRDEILNSMGLFRRPADILSQKLVPVFNHVAEDMAHISEAITSPIKKQNKSLQDEVEDVYEEIAQLKTQLSKTQKQINRLGKLVKTER